MADIQENLPVKNFKNLRIAVETPKQADIDCTCKCATYFNMENPAEHSSTCDNSPTTVKNTTSDSCVYGTHYPNRIFVGHLPGKATATDLADFFRTYGTVLEGKVVLDSFGRSRRFGFVTFATHEDVQNVLKEENVFFKGKKINVGPAVKKMFGAEYSPESPVESSQDPITSPITKDTTIITVPPVNEKKEENGPATPVSGNVWLKVNAKPKHVNKKSPEIIPTSSPTLLYTQQPMSPISPYAYPTTYYTVPYTQGYNNYQGYYYTQPPVYNTPCTQQVMFPYQQWSDYAYTNGPLSVM